MNDLYKEFMSFNELDDQYMMMALLSILAKLEVCERRGALYVIDFDGSLHALDAVDYVSYVLRTKSPE